MSSSLDPLPLIEIETVDGPLQRQSVSQPSWRDLGKASPDTAIRLEEFVNETHHHFYGRPWVLGRYYFDHLVRRGVKPGQNVLDLGCGAGRLGIHLIPYLGPGRYFGVEAHLRSLMAFSAYEAFMHNLSSAAPRLLLNDQFAVEHFGAAFDVVLDLWVTPHLPEAAAVAAYQRIARCMSPGARVIMCAPFSDGAKALGDLGLVLEHEEQVRYPMIECRNNPAHVQDVWQEYRLSG